MITALAVSDVIIPSVTADGIGPYDAEKLMTTLFTFLYDIFPYDRESVPAGIPGSCVEDPFGITAETPNQFVAVCHACFLLAFCWFQTNYSVSL
jgi:hypothetical protein